MKARARWSGKKRKVRAGVKRAGAEEPVHAGEKHFRVVADSLPEPLAEIASDQLYQFANAAFEQWWGLTSEQVKGRSVRELMGEEIYGTIQPYIEKALLGQSASFEGYLSYQKAGDMSTLTLSPAEMKAVKLMASIPSFRI
jgi:PAS domain S-box-containing protein